MPYRRIVAGCAGLVVASLAIAWARDEERVTPPEFEPFEYLLGAWKGTSLPAANKIRGWQEKHQWAWKFEKGKPVGLNLDMQGGKVVVKGLLSFDPKSKTYKLEAEGPEGKKAVYLGAFNKAQTFLTLDREGLSTSAAKERLILGLLDNRIRYTFVVDRKESGSPQFKHAIESSFTKEGEAFASGGGAADLPKCIVTGGSATMTVSFNGQSYPVCCSGCVDEFKENPEKYVKKFLARMQSGQGSPSGVAKTDSPAAEAPANKAAAAAAPAKQEAAKTTAGTAKKSAAGETKGKKTAMTKDAPSPSRAAAHLRQAEALEKSGRTEAAVTFYKKIVKDYPDSPQAKVAKEKIKKLEDQ